MIDTLLIGILSIALFALFVFVYARESAVSRKLRIFAQSIENLNQTVFKLEKQLRSGTTTEGKQENISELMEFNQLIVDRLEAMQQANVAFQSSITQRLMELENRPTQNNTYVPTQTPADENKIIEMFQNGMSIEEIARSQRMGSGEVEFLLKLRNFR